MKRLGKGSISYNNTGMQFAARGGDVDAFLRERSIVGESVLIYGYSVRLIVVRATPILPRPGTCTGMHFIDLIWSIIVQDASRLAPD